MKLGQTLGLMALALPFLVQPVRAMAFAANCRYDTEARTESHDYGPFAPPVVSTTPGQHRRMRLDVDTDKGTVKETEGQQEIVWNNGAVWKPTSGGSAKSIVSTDGRYVWFGAEFFKDDGSKNGSVYNRLDLQSGLLADQYGTQWECQKAGNIFQ